MPDKDLWDQLDGMFSDAVSAPIPEEEQVEDDLLLDQTLDDLLGLTAEPAAPAPSLVQAPPEVPVPTGKEETELPPSEGVVWDAEFQEQRVRMLNTLLGSMTAVATLLIGGLLVFVVRQPSILRVYFPYFVAYGLLLGAALARRLDPVVRAIAVILAVLTIGTVGLVIAGPLGLGSLYLVAAPLLSVVLVGRRAGLAAAAVSVLVYVSLALAHFMDWLQPVVLHDLTQWSTILNLGGGFVLIAVGMAALLWMFSGSLSEALATAGARRDEAVQAQTLLAEQSHQQTAENLALQQSLLQLQTAARVSRTVASVLDARELAHRAVDLIRQQFDLYYVGLFLLDELEPWAILRAATGEVGRRLLEKEHRLEVREGSLVGWCIINAQARIAQDASEGGMPIAHSLLPEAYSQMVLPLQSRGRVIGALDVQSSDPDAFSQRDITVFQSLSDQVAVAVDNALLFAEAQVKLDALEASHRSYEQDQWADFATAQVAPTYERRQPDVPPLDAAATSSDGSLVERIVGQVMTEREGVVQSSGSDGASSAAVVAPIRLRDQVIGTLGLEQVEGEREWTADEIALIESVADQMALAIENARLLEQTRMRADRERLITEITARVRASMDPDAILKTTVRELGRALGAERASVRVTGTIRDGQRLESAHGSEQEG